MSSSDEKQGLTRSFRSQTGYGTASVSSSSKKSVPRTRKFISKKVSRTDTLIGIALKYGVTVQDLKKENRLWTNDSLFLRETLLIPLTPHNETDLDLDDIIVSVDSVSSHPPPPPPPSSSSHPLHHHLLNNGATSSSSPSPSAVLQVENSSHHSSDLNHSTNNNNNNRKSPSSSSKHPSRTSSSSSSSSSSTVTASALSPPSTGGASCSADNTTTAASRSGFHSGNDAVGGASGSSSGDFFSKYDQSIAKLKGNVAKMEHDASTIPYPQEHPMALPPPSRNTSRPYQQQTHQNRRRSSTSAAATSITKSSSRSSSSSFGQSDTGSVHSACPDNDQDTARTRLESPVLMIRSRTNSRLVKTTLERSRLASEDLFEL